MLNVKNVRKTTNLLIYSCWKVIMNRFRFLFFEAKLDPDVRANIVAKII